MSGKKGLSARESELVAKAWQCLKTDPQIDFNKFAELCEYKNEATARVSWGAVRKKLSGAAGAAPSGQAGSKRKAAGSKPVSQPAPKLASEDDTDDENEASQPPSKKPRTKAVAAASKSQDQGNSKGKVKGKVRAKKEVLAVQDDDVDEDIKGQSGAFIKREPQDEDDTPYGAG
ncbi:hypothetical protein DL764_001942 [Monosporascus ibericus]|uniref:Uncharacterized protein n=1 Tax=Monosporascus ibericus TaxID=155417 RepID=A0A4Q4TSD3_9PEZI|nr:hypothetical protein DL764_001942 [Monosporascus ibericus]